VTKADLVAIMAKTAGGSKTSADRAMAAFFDGIFESLHKGRRVTFSGFGAFVVTRRAARAVRDPRNGHTIKIPSTKVPRFRPSRSLKDSVR
jgi:DNA-binding protein HU-beta